MIPDAGLVSLRPNRVDGWLINENAGYYVHQGRVYLQGEISTLEGVTASIFTSIPSQVCPSTDRHFTLYADLPSGTDDAIDPALILPNTYAATMHTDGSFSLDAPPPPQVISTPGGTFLYGGVTYPRYLEPMNLLISLPGVSWALEDDVDDYTPISFAPYLVGGDFTDIDATIAKHGSRVHLDGHVTANIDHAVWLSLNLPTDYQPASGVDGREAVINAQDPRIHRIGDVEHQTIGFNNDQPPLGVSPPGTFPYLFRGEALRPGVGIQNIFQIGDAIQRATVNESYVASCECTVYSLACIPEGTDHESPAVTSLGGHSATGSVAALLANYDPMPDWIRVSVSVEYSGGSGFGGCRPCVSDLGEYLGGGCIFHLGQASVHIDAPGPLIDNLGASVPNDVSYDYDAGDPVDHHAVIGTLAGAVPIVYVARPTVAYTGAPGAPDDWENILLWRPGEIDDVVFSWDGTQSDGSVAEWTLNIEPFWERRTAYFREGDVLDLTGCGWHLLTVAPGGEIVRAGPGTIRAFPGPGGLRPRGQSKMVRP